MSDMNIYTSKIAVLADFYLNYRDQDPYKDFAEYNDIGLPLAYVVHQNLVETNPGKYLHLNPTDAYANRCISLI